MIIISLFLVYFVNSGKIVKKKKKTEEKTLVLQILRNFILYFH